MRTASVCVVALAALVAASGPASAECPRAAVADGDPALVQGLTARLAASGIATTASAGCPAVRVTIEQRGTQVHVKLADAAQRTGERDVQDVATAAAIVESWTDQEIVTGTLPEVTEVAPPAVPAPVVVAAAIRHTSRSGIAASVLSGLGTNGGTTWIGGSLAACVRAGAFCVGAALRSQLDTTATGDTTTIAQDSYSLSALGTLDLPRRLRGFILSPGIGVGYAYLHVTTHHRDSMNNPLDIPTVDHQLRAAVHAALLRPWGEHLSVFADVWADAGLVRSDTQFGPGGSFVLALGLRIEGR